MEYHDLMEHRIQKEDLEEHLEYMEHQKPLLELPLDPLKILPNLVIPSIQSNGFSMIHAAAQYTTTLLTLHSTLVFPTNRYTQR